MTVVSLPSVRGEFDLAAAIRFLAGFEPAARPDAGAEPGVLRLAFPVDGVWAHAGAVIRQRSPGVVTVEACGPEEQAEAVVAQVARMLSLDVDAEPFAEVGARDPVVSVLRGLQPGLRPVLFASPYEAACWAVVCHRIRLSQAVRLRERLAERYGERLDVGGVPLVSFPAPHRLTEMELQRGWPGHKVLRLRAVAEAAAEGMLDAEKLRGMPAEEALKTLQLLPGIGRFSAELILIRGAGHPDVFPRAEVRLHALMREAYHVPEATVPELAELAEAWRPFRSWAAFLLRAEGEARLRRAAV